MQTLPTCASHYQLLEYKTFQEFLHWSPYAPHGSTHGSIGGIFGCDALDSMTERGYLRDQEGQRDLCKNWIFYLKELYRAGTLSPRKECAMNAKDASLSSCGFECNTKLKGEMKKMLYMILNSDYEVGAEGRSRLVIPPPHLNNSDCQSISQDKSYIRS